MKKKCAYCEKKKAIHFFTAHEWKSEYSRCRACLQERQNRRTGQTGTEYWRKTMTRIVS